MQHHQIADRFTERLQPDGRPRPLVDPVEPRDVVARIVRSHPVLEQHRFFAGRERNRALEVQASDGSRWARSLIADQRGFDHARQLANGAMSEHGCVSKTRPEFDVDRRNRLERVE